MNQGANSSCTRIAHYSGPSNLDLIVGASVAVVVVVLLTISVLIVILIVCIKSKTCKGYGDGPSGVVERKTKFIKY